MFKGFINGTLESAVEARVASFLESRPDLIERIATKSGDAFLKRLREIQQRPLVEEPVEVAAVLANHGQGKNGVGGNVTNQKKSTVPDSLASYSNYQVTKELGRGGMGVGYLAKNVQLDRL